MLEDDMAAYGGVEELPEPDPEIFDPLSTYNARIDYVRLALMLVVSINAFGIFAGTIGNFLQIVSGFAAIAFFILSGFLVLGEAPDRDQRILRAIGRTAITFVVMAVVYFLINAVFYAVGGRNIFSSGLYRDPKFWLSFLLLNVWPYDIGGLIWYVQALLYGYIILFLFSKLKLLRLDWLFFLFFAAFSLMNGEFAGIFDLRLLGFAYIPRGFLTTALPYLCLGCFMRRKLFSLMNVSDTIYAFLAVAGIALCFAEGTILSSFFTLVTTDHFIGMTLTAFAVCAITVTSVISYPEERTPYLAVHAKFYFRWIYYLLQPVSVVIAMMVTSRSPEALSKVEPWIWVLAYVGSLAIAAILGCVKDGFILSRMDDLDE